MKIDIRGDGLLDPKKLRQWELAAGKSVRKGVLNGLKKAGPKLRDGARQALRRGLKLTGEKLPRTLVYRVYDNDASKFPALYVGSSVPWLGQHETGGTINGRMLIPLLPEHRRIGKKAFKRIVRDMMSVGEGFFIDGKNGEKILMAENIRELNHSLRLFKSAERHRLGVNRLKRGHEVPIARLVTRVTLKKRFDFHASISRQMPFLARLIEYEALKEMRHG